MKQLKLISGFSKKAGRNNQGKITCNHKGGSLKKNIVILIFFENKFQIF
jgi:ribosomal protein L2